MCTRSKNFSSRLSVALCCLSTLLINQTTFAAAVEKKTDMTPLTSREIQIISRLSDEQLEPLLRQTDTPSSDIDYFLKLNESERVRFLNEHITWTPTAVAVTMVVVAMTVAATTVPMVLKPTAQADLYDDNGRNLLDY